MVHKKRQRGRESYETSRKERKKEVDALLPYCRTAPVNQQPSFLKKKKHLIK
jgi:hypothetical protein